MFSMNYRYEVNNPSLKITIFVFLAQGDSRPDHFHNLVRSQTKGGF